MSRKVLREYVFPEPNGVPRVTFRVPLPPRTLSSNGGGAGRRWGARESKGYRGIVTVMCKDGMTRAPAKWWPAKARIHLTWGIGPDALIPLYRPRDVWNAVAAWKAGFDGITDAGIWPDDSHRWAELGTVRIDPGLHPGIYVLIEQVQEAP